MIDTGYPAFRFVKDVVVNNNEVLDEQARMAQLAGMKDSWHVLAVKPKYHLYVVVIGKRAPRCPRRFRWPLGQHAVCQLGKRLSV
ncbi:hypothetical protein M3O75_05270 [Klebsiella pneumoniae]|nr:hypothetical protein [Klebsiella pneumoniae]